MASKPKLVQVPGLEKRFIKPGLCRETGIEVAVG